MSGLKTRPTRKSAEKLIRELEHPVRSRDAAILLALFSEITGCKPVVWGDSIIGFGRYHYRQRSGLAASWPITGFSVRKHNLTIYIMPGFDPFTELLDRLGKYKTARSCLYINKLADVDIGVFEQLIGASVELMQQRYRCD
ncbi:DUF1801 domain-containing protein [Marinobacterium jannaschii]|uniref:DUF1801 domain-containing protein n=1 Tax=Marinobacterium jannaschii TaxID=64970 RepID=UPI0004865952|nr:DUF1801 domain-containing protein [Marinobacterium jannaschii]